MVTPGGLGGDSGRHMAATDRVAPLKETPERPQIDLSVAVGNGDSFSHALRRAGVSESDTAKVADLVSGIITTGALTPGTRLDIRLGRRATRSEEHTSELQSIMRISYAVFCLKKKRNTNKPT